MKPAYVYEALHRASSFLEESRREPKAAEWLMKHHLNVDWTDFHLSRRDPVTDDVWEAFSRDVTQHAQGVPVQHLTGYEEFYGRRFHVNEHVLIPRPETEELVDEVLGWIRRQHITALQIADIGTGSGVIAITIALEAPDVQVKAVEISPRALATAQKNAADLGASVEFIEGSLMDPLLEGETKYDVIVSNPPYIPNEEWEALDPLVRDHDPKLALVGEDDGLACYRKMAVHLPALLQSRGLAAFEIGDRQGEDVSRILRKELPLADIEVRYDINKKPRMVFCERNDV
ncbi:peptide chain release factor N(5)-glutamine methyltransferase [Salibacterium halotolerans]|uniref:Release factor glutamine methyltransferase n=1 Tax=Salibacterium halotolerans TaxID=1884432 RepID=A0A1I5V3L1_9BACI|nr:peptide chain release factor N(5)-glutamine methyltransferase [Salibacterium halotolerans]SFQ01907.1 release factor glutamine methyltransferase [Salibacterium halotolerans]